MLKENNNDSESWFVNKLNCSYMRKNLNLELIAAKLLVLNGGDNFRHDTFNFQNLEIFIAWPIATKSKRLITIVLLTRVDWVIEWVSTRHIIIGHFGDESLQAINITLLLSKHALTRPIVSDQRVLPSWKFNVTRWWIILFHFISFHLNFLGIN